MSSVLPSKSAVMMWPKWEYSLTSEILVPLILKYLPLSGQYRTFLPTTIQADFVYSTDADAVNIYEVLWSECLYVCLFLCLSVCLFAFVFRSVRQVAPPGQSCCLRLLACCSSIGSSVRRRLFYEDVCCSCCHFPTSVFFSFIPNQDSILVYDIFSASVLLHTFYRFAVIHRHLTIHSS